jgi:hypothetical protein
MSIHSLAAGISMAIVAVAATLGSAPGGAAIHSQPHPAEAASQFAAPSAREDIPRAARVLEVEKSRHGKVLESISIQNVRAVHKVGSLIDGLPARQPGPARCDYATDGTRYHLTFRVSLTGPQLAEASQILPVIRHCTFMNVRLIGDQRWTSLERGGIVLRKIRSLHGKHIPQD